MVFDKCCKDYTIYIIVYAYSYIVYGIVRFFALRTGLLGRSLEPVRAKDTFLSAERGLGDGDGVRVGDLSVRRAVTSVSSVLARARCWGRGAAVMAAAGGVASAKVDRISLIMGIKQIS